MIYSKVRKRRVGIITVILYLLLLFDSGFYFVARGGSVLFFQLVLSALLVFTCKATIPQNSFLALYLLGVLVVIGTTFSDDSIRDIAVSLIELFSGFCLACSFTSKCSKDVEKASRIVMMSICICSLVAFLLTSLRINLVTKLPVFTSSNNVRCYFWGLSFSYVPGEYYIARNLGLFWEPGAFQVYIIIALIYELFIGGRALPKVIYSITILTTLSSTGIICLLMIWILYGFSIINKRGRGLLLLAVIACVLSLLYLKMDYLPNSIKFNLIDKIQSIFNGNSRNYVTVSTRMNSVVYGIELLLQRPLFGIGRGLSDLRQIAGNNIVSCTPINWMLQYGIVFGATALIGVYKFLQRIRCSVMTRIGLFVIILLSISTEAINISPTFFFIVFVGFSMKTAENLHFINRHYCIKRLVKDGKQ